MPEFMLAGGGYSKYYSLAKLTSTFNLGSKQVKVIVKIK
jgi:hypothetical protein